MSFVILFCWNKERKERKEHLFHLIRCTASAPSPSIYTMWCSRPYRPYIFCEDMIPGISMIIMKKKSDMKLMVMRGWKTCYVCLQPSEELSACQTIHVRLGRQGQKTFLAPISVWYLSSIFLIFVPVFGIIIYLSACQTIQMMLGELFDQFCNICAIFKLYLC